MFVCVFVDVLVWFVFSCRTYLEVATEGAHVLAQCASDLCRSTDAQYIIIKNGTTIP